MESIHSALTRLAKRDSAKAHMMMMTMATINNFHTPLHHRSALCSLRSCCAWPKEQRSASTDNMPRPGHNDLPAPDNTVPRYDRHGNVQHWPVYGGREPPPPVVISEAERRRRIEFSIFILRCLQTLIATIYLPFLLFSVTHKGWWTGIQRPMSLGCKLLPISHCPVAVVKLISPKTSRSNCSHVSDQLLLSDGPLQPYRPLVLSLVACLPPRPWECDSLGLDYGVHVWKQRQGLQTFIR